MRSNLHSFVVQSMLLEVRSIAPMHGKERLSMKKVCGDMQS